MGSLLKQEEKITKHFHHLSNGTLSGTGPGIITMVFVASSLLFPSKGTSSDVSRAGLVASSPRMQMPVAEFAMVTQLHSGMWKVKSKYLISTQVADIIIIRFF